MRTLAGSPQWQGRKAAGRARPAVQAAGGGLRGVEVSRRPDERSFAPPPPRPGDVTREAILARVATEMRAGSY